MSDPFSSPSINNSSQPPQRPPEQGKEWAQDGKGNWVQVTKGFGQALAKGISYIIGPPKGCGGCGKK